MTSDIEALDIEALDIEAPHAYRVKLLDSETSIRCGLRSGFDYDYCLIVSSDNILLTKEGKVVFVWPYRYIRRYGGTKDGFSLEAGRGCSSGEGLFSFITKDGNTIFKVMASHIKILLDSQQTSDKISQQNLKTNELRPQPITPIPLSLSSKNTSKTIYLATNSSLLPSTKISETLKTPSIDRNYRKFENQSPTRVTTVSNNNSIDRKTDSMDTTLTSILKSKPKSKETKLKDLNDSEMTVHSMGAHNSNQYTSSASLNQSVPKFASVLKVMFNRRAQNKIHIKYKDNLQSNKFDVSVHSNSKSTPVPNAVPQKIESNVLTNPWIADKKDENRNTFDINSDNDSNYYSIVFNESTQSIESSGRPQYKNVSQTDSLNDNNFQTEHYIQNECEYARVVRKGVFNTLV